MKKFLCILGRIGAFRCLSKIVILSGKWVILNPPPLNENFPSKDIFVIYAPSVAVQLPENRIFFYLLDCDRKSNKNYHTLLNLRACDVSQQ